MYIARSGPHCLSHAFLIVFFAKEASGYRLLASLVWDHEAARPNVTHPDPQAPEQLHCPKFCMHTGMKVAHQLIVSFWIEVDQSFRSQCRLKDGEVT
jgi:hypothetical protein